MKLVNFSKKGSARVRVGMLINDNVHSVLWDGTLEGLIQRGITPNHSHETFPLGDVRLHAPLKPGKIIAVGRNYADHAAELANNVPEKPLLFAIYGTSVIGPDDTIQWYTDVTNQVDWEGELAVIIGKSAYRVSEEDAMNYVYGYTIANDVSARDLQASDDQWARAKGLDTFCPLGPCIVTRDEIADPHDLTITTTVNEEEMQNASTGLMMFKIPHIISFASHAFTLEPGDVILTGTPSGVGKGKNPPQFLQDGDTVTVSISDIGSITNTCKVLNG